jgi:hypothetical protein
MLRAAWTSGGEATWQWCKEAAGHGHHVGGLSLDQICGRTGRFWLPVTDDEGGLRLRERDAGPTMGAGGVALLPACVYRADGAGEYRSWMWRTIEGVVAAAAFWR